MTLAKIEQIWQLGSNFSKNDCVNEKFFKIEIQLVQLTRLDESDKTALAKSNYFINGK